MLATSYLGTFCDRTSTRSNLGFSQDRFFWVTAQHCLTTLKRPTHALLQNTQQTDLVTKTSCARGIRRHRKRGLTLGSVDSCPCHRTGLLEKQDLASKSGEFQELLSKPWRNTDTRGNIPQEPGFRLFIKTATGGWDKPGKLCSPHFLEGSTRARQAKTEEGMGKHVQLHSGL